MYLDLWITGSAWCLSGPLKRLAYSRIDLLCCSVSLHLKGHENMGDSEPPDILYETCALSFPLLIYMYTVATALVPVSPFPIPEPVTTFDPKN